MKIIDKIKHYETEKIPYYSFEYFPPKTKTGLENLYFKLKQMGQLEPLFVDVTWGAGGSTANLTEDLCDKTQNLLCLETQMHLTCTNLDPDMVKTALDSAKTNGIQNILALRGDRVESQANNSTTDTFEYALDLIKYIRENHGNYFGISVAGYPEGHPDSSNYQDDLRHLKAKVEAGADFIVTQLFYQVDHFLKFVRDCRQIGITCPILPGILPFINYNSLMRMVRLTRVEIPKTMLDHLETIRNDDRAVEKYGQQVTLAICQTLRKAGVLGFHFYTLNRIESTKYIIESLDIQLPSSLPWRPRLNSNEETRPVFWANLSSDYLVRTQGWVEYPNGRWGNRDSEQFGDSSVNYLFGRKPLSEKVKLEIWGSSPKTLDDIGQIFINYLDQQINHLPWCDSLEAETTPLITILKTMCQRGYLTINSQPEMFGKASDGPDGWGGPGGKLFQKEYLEFFCNKTDINQLLGKIASEGVTYCAVNKSGHVITNSKGSVSAITWGIFPRREVIQPTVADYNSFMVWKDEAFQLWMDEWAAIYPKDSVSWNLLKRISDSFYLIYLVNENLGGPSLLETIVSNTN